MEINPPTRRRKVEIKDSKEWDSTLDIIEKKPTKKWIKEPFHLNKLFLYILIIRLFNSLTIRTFFQADEFYQCLEPAYNAVFNSGYITWEWEEGIRSSIHPLIYALGYKIASLVQADGKLIIITPKIIGALIASIGELYLYILCKKLTGNEIIAKLALALSLLNPFNWYIITRSFSNSFETALTTIALAYWPWNNTIKYKRISISCIIAFISCIVRPTNGIIWIYLGLNFMIKNYLMEKRVDKLLKLILLLAVELILVLLANIVLDYKFYGKLTFPLYNFVEFNVIRNLSIFYGVAPWHFYLFQGLPIILMTYLPWFLYSMIVLKGYSSILGQLVIIMIGGFSLIDHKEIRFIYPLQPVFLIMVAYAIYHSTQRYQRVYKLAIPLMVIINVMIAVFFTQIHERGVIDVIEYLRSDPQIESFGFLTPCHSTPWESHINNPILAENSWFLTCKPPLHLQTTNPKDISAYRDESDQFYDNPAAFLKEHFGLFDNSRMTDTKEWPSCLIIFAPLENFMNDFFGDSNYLECERFFNSYFHWDNRRKGDLIVYCQKCPSH